MPCIGRVIAGCIRTQGCAASSGRNQGRCPIRQGDRGKIVRRSSITGIATEVKPRMQFFPNGYAAMRWLAENGGRSDVGITQITEILANKGVAYAGPLPPDLQTKTVYAAGLAARAAEPTAARAFISRLTDASAKPVLIAAGYG